MYTDDAGSGRPTLYHRLGDQMTQVKEAETHSQVSHALSSIINNLMLIKKNQLVTLTISSDFHCKPVDKVLFNYQEGKLRVQGLLSTSLLGRDCISVMTCLSVTSELSVADSSSTISQEGLMLNHVGF